MYLNVFNELSGAYLKYNINEDIIKNTVQKVITQSTDETDCIKRGKIILDSYLVENANSKSNYKEILKEEYSYIKVMIRRNKNLLYKVNIMAENIGITSNEILDIILDYAIVILLYDHGIYNNNLLFSQNLLNEMKIIITSKIYSNNIYNIIKNYKNKKRRKKNNNSNVKYDISFLNKKNISKKKLADAISVNYTTLNSYLYGKTKAPKKVLDKILKLFNVKTYEELKQGVIDDTLVVPQELLNKVSKNIYLDSKDSIKDISEYIYNENELPEILKIINIDILLNLLDKSSITVNEYMIIILIFGGLQNNNRRIYYKIDSVYKLLHIEKEYVVDLYKKCLKLYNESLIHISNEDNKVLINELNKNLL